MDAIWGRKFYKNFRMLAIRLRAWAVLVYSDGKKKIVEGEPGNPVSAASRNRKAAMVVAEDGADHDTGTKFGIIPDVNFFAFIPENIDEEGAFYRGLTYVHLREDILNGSHPLKHAAELLFDLHDLGKIDMNQNPIWVSPEFCVMMQFTDGGTDHRCTLAKSKVAQIAVYLICRLDASYKMRCIPNNSYVSSAERCMDSLNFCLQTIVVERAKAAPALEAELAKCGNKKQIRAMCEKQGDDVKRAVSQLSMPCMIKIARAFSEQAHGGEQIRIGVAATEDDAASVLKALTSLAPLLDMSTLTNAGLHTTEGIKLFLDHLCADSSLYEFEIKKCGNQNCCVPGCGPTRMPADEFSQHVGRCPFPTKKKDPSTGKVQDEWETFDATFQKPTSEEYRPSIDPKLLDPVQAALDAKRAKHFTIKHVIGDVQCCVCGKNRPIFKLAKPKDPLDGATAVALQAAMEMHPYACGSCIVPEGPLDEKVAVETALTCGIRQSDVYYACKLFPPSCAHCGETEDLNVNQTLLGQYHVVHPICTICKEQGLPYPHSKKIDHAKTPAQQARVQKLRAGTTKVTVDKKRKRGIDSALDTEGLIQPQQPRAERIRREPFRAIGNGDTSAGVVVVVAEGTAPGGSECGENGEESIDGEDQACIVVGICRTQLQTERFVFWPEAEDYDDGEDPKSQCTYEHNDAALETEHLKNNWCVSHRLHVNQP